MESGQVAEPQAEQKKQDLHTRHVEGFVRVAETDIDQALAQYGFTVWHSLPPREAALLKERVGLQALTAADCYNRGTANAMEGKWAEAVADLRASLKLDPDYAPAVHNLAVSLESEGKLHDAREAYRNYLKLLDRARARRDLRLGNDNELALEAARIQQHLETLGSA